MRLKYKVSDLTITEDYDTTFMQYGFTLYNEFDSRWENDCLKPITQEIIKRMSEVNDIETLRKYFGSKPYQIYTFWYDDKEYSFHNPTTFRIIDGLLRVACATLDGSYASLFIANKVSRIEHHMISNPDLEAAYEQKYSELSSTDEEEQIKNSKIEETHDIAEIYEAIEVDDNDM